MERTVIGQVYSLRGDYPAEAVRVDRSTRWGNPFRIKEGTDRDTVIEYHQIWFDAKLKCSPKFVERVRALAGKDLVCWCAPKACHADHIAKRAMELSNEEPAREEEICVDCEEGIVHLHRTPLPF